MSLQNGLRFLRPYLSRDLCVRNRTAYVRFFSSARCLFESGRGPPIRKTVSGTYMFLEDEFKFNSAIEERIEGLKAAGALAYPRIKNDARQMTCSEFRDRYTTLNAEALSMETVTLRGRIKSIRLAGKGLIFIDIVQNGTKVQAMCNLSKITMNGVYVSSTAFNEFGRLIRRGDIISILGHPYDNQGKAALISIRAIELPTILSPSLATLPTVLEDPETRIRNRHVDLLVNKSVSDTIRLRSYIIRYVRDFLHHDSFLEVQTPIIADSAGGATARPFTTSATEFPDKQLALRIAPEIWLKRLVLGGLDRVFEIGPVFRNEGLDATHNPEFMTCEFYKSFADLEELMSMTETLVCGLQTGIASLGFSSTNGIASMDSTYSTPFRRIEFVPAIEEALAEKLPHLVSEDATDQLISLFRKHDLLLPSPPTLPRLLDKLASTYIEPQCTTPTFITHHPACMAPLAKSFLDPTTNQHVSARAELFIEAREIANMYEEENSPFEQRAKFLQQVKYRDDENRAYIDESYLEALQWGLPPTGGWGCGLDRLVMLFSGSPRISDVLSFGSLRNVVSLGSPGKA